MVLREINLLNKVLFESHVIGKNSKHLKQAILAVKLTS